jgi:hypothetical protein
LVYYLLNIGGAIYVSNCSSVEIFGCTFKYCNVSMGYGGGIFFGVDVAFSIESSLFFMCVSRLGCGGAIACCSVNNGRRKFVNVSFSRNSGNYNNKGNDLYDFSSSADSFLTYLLSFTKVSSDSFPVRFYYSYIDHDFDCLISDMDGVLPSCLFDEVYLNNKLGFDSPACGYSDISCKTLSFVIKNKIEIDGKIYIFFGNYPQVGLTLTKGFTCEGVVDSVDIADDSKYPVIFPVSGNIMFITSESQKFIFTNLKFLVGMNSMLFRVHFSQSDLLVIKNCVFVPSKISCNSFSTSETCLLNVCEWNDLENTCLNSNRVMKHILIDNNCGILVLENSRFYDIISSEGSLIDYSHATEGGFTVVNNCSFCNISNINITTTNSAVFSISMGSDLYRLIFI